MALNLLHAAPAATASFFASLVESVEALTVVLAVGTTRGWRDTLSGCAAALVVLVGLTAVLGPALTLAPLHVLKLAVGMFLLLFGLRWLRKAILRAAGVLALHDEAAIFARQRALMTPAGDRGGARDSGRARDRGRAWDATAFGSAFHITMLEGSEVVFIVIAAAAGGADLLVPASLGALAAVVLVAALGVIVHAPLSRTPENTLKFIVGTLLSAFGAFWAGEGAGVAWPFGDAALAGLVAGFALVALACVPLCRTMSQRAATSRRP